jgi:hypothetical protein
VLVLVLVLVMLLVLLLLLPLPPTALHGITEQLRDAKLTEPVRPDLTPAYLRPSCCTQVCTPPQPTVS